MLTHKDAKTMAKSLRDSLGNRSVMLSHSECLEIVARQFGLPDWNTLAAKVSREAEPQKISEPAPWSKCSFCGESPPKVRIALGGCGGWDGFRARRNPESGERSNVFICNECVKLCTRIVTGTVDVATDANAASASATS